MLRHFFKVLSLHEDPNWTSNNRGNDVSNEASGDHGHEVCR